MKFYFVELFDSTLDLLWRSNAVLQREVIPSQDLFQKLIPKETYFWMVTSVFEGENKVKSRLIKLWSSRNSKSLYMYNLRASNSRFS